MRWRDCMISRSRFVTTSLLLLMALSSNGCERRTKHEAMILAQAKDLVSREVGDGAKVRIQAASLAAGGSSICG